MENSIVDAPIGTNIHGLGLLFTDLFPNKDYFSLFNQEHKVQALTESNKDGAAYRKGIYLSHVARTPTQSTFHLLRCSTNFEGPTENFDTTDLEILAILNIITENFKEPTMFNHVLAQIYYNQQRKARIALHSDKTKDMPKNGLIAFCTFYEGYVDGTFANKNFKKQQNDWFYKNASVLTTLRFKLKACVDDPTLPKQFDITLYPNSAFIISLKTNRLYCHEIVPPNISPELIPTRLGYIARCSNQQAVFKDSLTHIDNAGISEPLVPATEEKIKALKAKYLLENSTADHVDYDHIDFSLNLGDYIEPRCSQ